METSARQIPGDPQRRLLVVDDEPLLRDFYAQALEHCGHGVVMAADGQTALELYGQALRQGRPFDLVLMDMRMPGLDGKACAEALLSLDPGAKVIIISGECFLELGQLAERLLGIITKPVGMMELLREVQEVLPG
jgi:CheY-like chemotaxis protein